MKKLSKLKLNNATALNDKEMKDIVGGAKKSPFCREPELLFECYISIPGYGNPFSGVVCALDAFEAESRTSAQIDKYYFTYFWVSCS